MQERIPQERNEATLGRMLDPAGTRLESPADYFHASLTYFGRPTLWRNRPIWKFQADMQRYWDLIWRERFEVVLETGCQGGGSSVFFMDCMYLAGLASPYIGVDIKYDWWPEAHEHKQPHMFVRNDVLAPETLATVAPYLAGRKSLIVLDSVHTEVHVTAELDQFTPLVTVPGSYIVIEDTDHGARPVFANYGPSAAEAVEKFMKSQIGVWFPAFEYDTEIERRYGVTNSPRGWLRKV